MTIYRELLSLVYSNADRSALRANILAALNEKKITNCECNELLSRFTLKEGSVAFAERLCLNCLACDPKRFSALRLLAEIYWESKELEKLQAALQQYIDLAREENDMGLLEDACLMGLAVKAKHHTSTELCWSLDFIREGAETKIGATWWRRIGQEVVQIPPPWKRP